MSGRTESRLRAYALEQILITMTMIIFVIITIIIIIMTIIVVISQTDPLQSHSVRGVVDTQPDIWDPWWAFIPQDLYNPCLNLMIYAKTMHTPTVFSRRRRRHSSQLRLPLLRYLVTLVTLVPVLRSPRLSFRLSPLIPIMSSPGYS